MGPRRPPGRPLRRLVPDLPPDLRLDNPSPVKPMLAVVRTRLDGERDHLVVKQGVVLAPDPKADDVGARGKEPRDGYSHVVDAGVAGQCDVGSPSRAGIG